MTDFNKCEPKVMTFEYHRDSAENTMRRDYHTGLAEMPRSSEWSLGGAAKTLNFGHSFLFS